MTHALLVSLLLLAGCSAKPPSVDKNTLLEARLSSLEAALAELRAGQERVQEAIETLKRRKAAPAPRKGAAGSVKSGKVKKSPKLPITRLSPGDLSEATTEEGETESGEWVADSRHESLHLYRQAWQMLKEQKPDEAIEVLRRFLKENPDHVYADRAQYLIAEAHFHNREYGLVLVATNLLETRYPHSFRLGDALYYRALALMAMGQKGPAADALRDVVKRFPQDPVAESASRKLAELSVNERSRDHVPLLPSAGT